MQTDTVAYTNLTKLTQQLDGILNASLNGIIAYEAVRDTLGAIVDFIAISLNRVAQQVLQLPDTTPGWHLLARFPGIKERGSFDKFIHVVETGESLRFETPYEAAGQISWYDVSMVRMGDGFVITFDDITHSRRSVMVQEQQNELLQGILNTSLNNVFVYEAIREPGSAGRPGPIRDFAIRLVNAQARQDTLNWLGVDPTGRTLLTTNPDSRQTGQFDLYCRVTETGQTIRTEQFYPTAYVWFDTSITKLNDGCVVTGVNITAQKQATLAVERQADLLNNVLDSSGSGIKALEAVRDSQGNIVDFIVRLINAAGAAIRGQNVGDLIGQRATEAFPGLGEAGLFDHYAAVANTGHRRYLQAQYSEAWYDLAITPFGDGVVVTYTDISESRRAKLAIEQAAAENLWQASFLNSVLDASSNGIVTERAMRNADGVIIDFLIVSANQQAAQIVQSTVDDLVGHGDLELHPTLRETGLFDAYVRTVETGEPQFIEIYYNDGRLDHWVNINTRKLGTDELVITFSNVSDVKRTQQAIEQQAAENQQQADLLNSVLNSSQNGIMSFEAIRDAAGAITDFRFVTINQASESIVGVPLSTMHGSTLLTLFPGNVDSGLFALYVHTTETGEPGRTEVYYNHDGLDFWLDISAQKLGDGFVVTFTDTSIIKRAAKAVELAAADSERQADLLNTVLDNSQTAISLHEAIRDADGRVVDFRAVLANSRARAMWGELAGPIMNQPFFAVSSPQQQAFDFPQYVRVIETGEPALAEFSIGEQRLLRLTAKSGDGIVISNIDITEIHRLQQQLEASVVDLQRSNANLEQFAYVASHDLQEPLRKIQAFGDIVTSQYAPLLGPQGTDMIQRMQSAAARMQVLIKDVLAYSRIATRRENIGPVNMNEVVNEVLENLETAIADKQALFTVESLPIVTGDAPQLRQLMQNLLSNALKFIRPDTIPRISLRSTVMKGDKSGMDILAADTSRLFHLIEIQDNGIGFEPHHAERIFQVFQRLHSRSSYEGTGIGLAIVHKVVDNHQGYIEAVGRPGEGATFRILLPVTG